MTTSKTTASCPSDSEDECDLWDPSSEPSKFSFSKAKELANQYEHDLLACLKDMTKHNRVRLVEVACDEQSRLSVECERLYGKGSAMRLSWWNGGNLETQKGRDWIISMIQEVKPDLVWISPECGPYSPMQRLNQRTPQQREALEEKRQHARLQYEGAAKVIRAAWKLGIHSMLEMSERCEGWSQDWCHKLALDVPLAEGVCKGCQVGLRNAQGVLLCKGWRLQGTWGPLVQHMTLSCNGRHPKAICEGGVVVRQTAFYTDVFARRVCKFLGRASDSWSSFSLEVNSARPSSGPTESCYAADDSEQPEAAEGPAPQPEPVDNLADLAPDVRKRIFQNLKRIHTASGHCSLDYLKRSLKRRGANRDVMRCVEHFKCDVCQERRRPDPRPVSSLVELVSKWDTLQCDGGTWTHPVTGERWQFFLGIDEGSRLRVAKLLFQHQTRTPSAQDFLTFFEEQWLPHFGRPQTIRLDPAGSFRSCQLDQYFAERNVMLQEIPAEAHWQISVVERAIQTTKVMMNSLIAEFPEMTTSEALARSLWAANTHDQYRGFSPLQHAFGRSPDTLGNLGESRLKDLPILTESGISAEFGRDVKAMVNAEKAFLEEQAKERLQRALHAGSRPMKQVFPGDLVYVWRIANGKKDGTRHIQKGQFVGPCRVLATETRKDDDGTLRPGSVVWLYRGGNLVKAAPQQLRPATAREEAWQELVEPVSLPWTIADTLRQNPPRTFDDITDEAQHMPRTLGELEAQDVPTHRHRSKRRAPQTLTPALRPTASGSQASSSDQAPAEFFEDQHRGQLQVSDGLRQGLQDPNRSRSPLTRGRTVGHRTPTTRDDFLEECGIVFPEMTQRFWQEQNPAIELAVTLPKVTSRQGKEWVRDLGCYFVKQLKRQQVEVSEKHLTQKELEGFRKAKGKEVKNFVIPRGLQSAP